MITFGDGSENVSPEFSQGEWVIVEKNWGEAGDEKVCSFVVVVDMWQFEVDVLEEFN